MRYCVLIIDGAGGWPLADYKWKTCLDLAQTPNLDMMAIEGTVGLVRTVPLGMEPSSACACMSILGYDPNIHYHGRAAIEARSMSIPVDQHDVVFRCNLVAVQDGKMWSYSSGHISTEEARELITALDVSLGSDTVRFFPGVSYRHICKLTGHEDTIRANCTPPHDIAGKAIVEFLPYGAGSELLVDLMTRSQAVLQNHPVNIQRRSRGEIPATMIWLFWGSGEIADMRAFEDVYGLNAAMTSGVDIMRGLARMVGMKVLDVTGVTGGFDDDYAGQAAAALKALEEYDLVVIHVEAPDEAGHAGSVKGKVEAIQRVDKEIVSQLRVWNKDILRVLIMPDHPTPIEIQTHVNEPVPFILWGLGFTGNGAMRFTEAEAKKTGVFIGEGYNIMSRLVQL
jgi:2,3-bisphosphoglycerate-independent phosphoglycerate mutase